MTEAMEVTRAQPVTYVDETGAPTGNADGNNPTGKRGRQWVMVTAVVTVFIQGLSRSTAAVIELLVRTFGGIVLSDRLSVYNHLPLERRQICWAHMIRYLTAIAERPGASAEFGAELQQACVPIRQSFEAALRWVVELGHQRGERTPWAKTVGTSNKLLSVADGLWTYLTIKGIEPTKNAAERGLPITAAGRCHHCCWIPESAVRGCCVSARLLMSDKGWAAR